MLPTPRETFAKGEVGCGARDNLNVAGELGDGAPVERMNLSKSGIDTDARGGVANRDDEDEDEAGSKIGKGVFGVTWILGMFRFELEGNAGCIPSDFLGVPAGVEILGGVDASECTRLRRGVIGLLPRGEPIFRILVSRGASSTSMEYNKLLSRPVASAISSFLRVTAS